MYIELSASVFWRSKAANQGWRTALVAFSIAQRSQYIKRNTKAAESKTTKSRRARFLSHFLVFCFTYLIHSTTVIRTNSSPHFMRTRAPSLHARMEKTKINLFVR
jgi:hypothetical protein